MARVWVVEHRGRSSKWRPAIALITNDAEANGVLCAFDFKADAQSEMLKRAARNSALEYRFSEYVRVERKTKARK